MEKDSSVMMDFVCQNLSVLEIGDGMTITMSVGCIARVINGETCLMLGGTMQNAIQGSFVMEIFAYHQLHAHLAGGTLVLVRVEDLVVPNGEIPEIVERDFSVMVRHVGQSPSVQRGGGVIIPVK